LFRLVTEAAFVNPFSLRRSNLDVEISEGPVDASWRERTLQRVGRRLDALAPPGKLDLATFAEDERGLVEHTVMFEAFHRCLAPLDQLIEQQLSHTAGPLRVSFAQDFQRGLAARGVGPERAQRVFELFFQMRRAFYFISRGLVGQSSC